MDMRKVVRKGLRKPIEVLFLQGNPDEVRLTREALKDAKMRANLHVVEHGMEAIAFLRREGKYRDAPRPDLIMLDLHLLKEGGEELMATIRMAEKENVGRAR
jgi:two-component system response regulator